MFLVFETVHKFLIGFVQYISATGTTLEVWLGPHNIKGSPMNWNGDPVKASNLTSAPEGEYCLLISAAGVQTWRLCSYSDTSIVIGALCYKEGGKSVYLIYSECYLRDQIVIYVLFWCYIFCNNIIYSKCLELVSIRIWRKNTVLIIYVGIAL